MIRWEYLLSTMLGLLIALLLDRQLHTGLWRQRRFYGFLGLMAGCTLIFNGYLTSRPVTLYDPCCHLQPRLPLVQMPVEDLLFGTVMVSIAIILWEWAGGRIRNSTGGNS